MKKVFVAVVAASMALGGCAQEVCTDPVVTTDANGNKASSMSCDRTFGF